MLMSALLGSHQLCIFEQFCDSGLGAPTHRHAVEEMLEVLSGQAEVWVDGTATYVEARQSVLLPAGAWHGFRNAGVEMLHVRATLAAPIFEAQYEDEREAGRRWSATGFPERPTTAAGF